VRRRVVGDDTWVVPPPRKSPHLRDYEDAQAGAYFVTICTYDREWLFGEVIEGEGLKDSLCSPSP
jgi:hypothetical protein